jgi:hypothetical protein
VDKLWHASALGMLPRLEELLEDAAAAGLDPDELTTVRITSAP